MHHTILSIMSLCPAPVKKVYKHFIGLRTLVIMVIVYNIIVKFTSFFVVSMKTPVARSISTGSGISTTTKDQNVDMNGPLVPEKVLKSIQVCMIYLTKDCVLQCQFSNRLQMTSKCCFLIFRTI